jgi:hypothetical protein
MMAAVAAENFSDYRGGREEEERHDWEEDAVGEELARGDS